MILYHYRPIESALLEIGNATLHFATREELNDPVEGYVRVFWQRDKAAWEGLLRNYVCSVSQAIDLYLLRGDEDMLHHKTLIVDLHQFDNVPLGDILKELGDVFLADEEIQKLAAFYGNHELKVREEELRLLLHFIHNKALSLCIKKCLDRKTMPEEMANSLLDRFRSFKESLFPFDLMKEELSDSEHRAKIAKVAADVMEEMRELQYVRFGFDDDTFLYGKHRDVEATEARQRRNWMAVAVDFPKVYVDQLKEMIYPQSFVVCFSEKSDNSAMWGNYADHHRGVCLIYEVDEENQMVLNHSITLVAKPVTYEGNLIERNFFETFGRLTMEQIRMWLKGVDGISSAYDAFKDKEEWKNRYWSAYEAKTYRKLRAWKHESEYRLALTNTFYDFNEPASRNLEYDPKTLKGLIFGINTSEYDKKRIMGKLLIHANEYADFTFFQAEYDDEAQCISVRQKAFWKLKES